MDKRLISLALLVAFAATASAQLNGTLLAETVTEAFIVISQVITEVVGIG